MAPQVRKILDDHGMKAENTHFTMEELRTSQQKSIAWAKDVGITQMMTASLGGGNGRNNPTLDQVKKAADEYNKIAAVAAEAGMQQGLHNEGFEISMVDGKRTYDLLLELLDPKLVKFQFQMSTITAGFVGTEYFLKYPGRFSSMHLQNIDMNAPVRAAPRQRAQRESGAAGPGRPPGRGGPGHGSIGSRPSPPRRQAGSRTTSSSKTGSSRSRASLSSRPCRCDRTAATVRTSGWARTRVDPV